MNFILFNTLELKALGRGLDRTRSAIFRFEGQQVLRVSSMWYYCHRFAAFTIFDIDLDNFAQFRQRARLASLNETRVHEDNVKPAGV